MNKCTYTYFNHDTNRLESATFDETDWNELEMFIETIGCHNVKSIEINDKKTSVHKGEHIVFMWEQKYMLDNKIIDQETYDNNIKCENERYLAKYGSCDTRY